MVTTKQFIECMKHSPLNNYAGIPGVTSWLIGGPCADGSKVRLLECSREHIEPIVPHSHRFSFHCQVLSGLVRNEIWNRAPADRGADVYSMCQLKYRGQPGLYDLEQGAHYQFERTVRNYGPGDCYTMEAREIHSIWFERGTSVLFFEGPVTRDASVILQPVVDDEMVQTFHVAPWAFRGQP